MKNGIHKPKNLWLWILIGVVVIVLLWGVFSYNRFVSLSQNVDGSWSEVENQYQRQADLIPNLVSTVASSAKVETKFVTDVTNARTQWQSASGQYAKDQAGVQMNNGLTAFVNAVATAEAYPILQANKQYVALTDELTGTQNRITVARARYINSIQAYNTAIRLFPGNILSGMFGFAPKDYYKAETIKTPSLGTGTLP